MNNDFYRFSEIVFGLRNEYIKNQKLLEELKQYISVNGENIDKVIISADIDLKGWHMIKLDILKKQSKILKILDYYAYEIFGILSQGEPYLKLNKVNNEFEFGIDDYYKLLAQKSNYNVEITDKKAFEEIAEEILNSEFMKLQEVYKQLNPFQSISIEPHEIYMYGDFGDINSHKFSSLTYMPTTDTIAAIPDCKHGIHLIRKFFDTEIPKYIIPKAYQKIIDKNIQDYDDLSSLSGLDIDCAIDKPTELAINEQNRGIVLTKKKRIKLYDCY